MEMNEVRLQSKRVKMYQEQCRCGTEINIQQENNNTRCTQDFFRSFVLHKLSPDLYQEQAQDTRGVNISPNTMFGFLHEVHTSHPGDAPSFTDERLAGQ